MLVSLWGSRWREVNLVFTVFVDDSGRRPTHRVAVATALVIPAAQICRLEREWKSFCEKEGMECFHASPCNAGTKDFKGWDEAKIDRVFQRVRQISVKYGVRAFSAAVNKRYYDEEIPEEYKKYTGSTHYSWCVDYALAYADKGWRTDPERGIPPFEFVFDWLDVGDPLRKEVEEVMVSSERVAREEGRAGAYEKYSFRRSRDYPGLQLVDGISWACNRFALHRIHQKHLPERARISFDFFGGPLRFDGWLNAFSFSRESLHEAVEKDGGKLVERYLRWEREDREKGIRIRQI